MPNETTPDPEHVYKTSLEQLASRPDVDDLYTVVCGYEWMPTEMLEYSVTRSAIGAPRFPSVVSAYTPIGSASHLVRTLKEHGEPDMCYWMIPSILYEFLEENYRQTTVAKDVESTCGVCDRVLDDLLDDNGICLECAATAVAEGIKTKMDKFTCSGCQVQFPLVERFTEAGLCRKCYERQLAKTV